MSTESVVSSDYEDEALLIVTSRLSPALLQEVVLRRRIVAETGRC